MLARLTQWMYGSAGWIAAICLIAAIAGCSGTEVGNPGTEDPGLPSDGSIDPLASDQELEKYLKNQYAKSVNVNIGQARPELDGGGVPDAADDSAVPSTDAYSRTNLQEAGVDESDMVKTDGDYFYVAGRKSFSIVDISDAMSVAATGSVDGYIDSLYLYDDKLLVLFDKGQPGGGQWDDIMVPEVDSMWGMPYWIPPARKQSVAVFDISEPANPALLKTLEFDGYLVSSRRIGGKLHLVQQFMPQLPPLECYYDGTEEDKQNKISANQKAIETMSLEQLIPFYRVLDGSSAPLEQGPAVSSENFYRPVSKKGGGTVTTIVSIDLDDPDLSFESVAMVANAHIVYASTEAIYITTHQYLFDAAINEAATIYKFDLTEGAAKFAGGGTVPGWILNQFSLGEHEKVLRVATTVGRAGGWGPTSKNNIYCLQQEGDKLNIIGKIEDLAPGERIYAARFMGEKGYLVTFVQIDPLFTLDLSDPNSPQMVGSLKVPGYSDYIHPYGDQHLITVGKNQGVQLSIFDVSDFAEPALQGKVVIGDSDTNAHTEVSWNHKAFAFWAEKDLLALPIAVYERPSAPDHGSQTFEGLYIYRVSTADGFEFLGRIETEDGLTPQGPYSYWTRGIFVKEKVYAVTTGAVRSVEIDRIGESVQTLYLDQRK